MQNILSPHISQNRGFVFFFFFAAAASVNHVIGAPLMIL